MEVKYKRTVSFLGRNGTFNQTGICIDEFDDRIRVYPITSKGDFGRAHIEIPTNSIKEVIQALKNYDKG